MPPVLTDLKGVGEATAKLLATNGLSSVKAVAEAATGTIVSVPGFGAARAGAIKSAAIELLALSRGTATAASGGKDSKPKGKKKGKKKKDKKGKKKGKKKKDQKGKKRKRK